MMPPRWWMYLALLTLPSVLCAHQIAENAIDVVIYPQKITIDARISMEEVLAVEANSATRPPREVWSKLAAKHEPYVLAHLKIQSDGQSRSGKPTTQPSIAPAAGSRLHIAPRRSDNC